MLFDTHAHLNDEQFNEDVEDVIRHAFDGGVTRMLIASYDSDSSRKAVELSLSRNFLYCSVGIHPDHAEGYDRETEKELSDVLTHNPGKVVAVGEIGLDYHYNNSPADIQMDVFKRQIRMAIDHDLPVIIHNRKASDDCLAVVSECAKNGLLRKKPGVFHHFSGDIRLADKLLEMGFYLSFAGPVTFKNAKYANEVLRNIPEDRILIETDCPYLAPEPFRGRRNEPLYVRYVAEKVAEITGKSISEIETITYNNACELFSV